MNKLIQFLSNPTNFKPTNQPTNSGTDTSPHFTLSNNIILYKKGSWPNLSTRRWPSTIQHRRGCLRHLNGLLWPWPLTSKI